MKYRNYRNRIQTPLIALALASGLASAGTTETTAAAPAPAPEEDVVSGVLKLDVNSHFISYGADVWGNGWDLGDATFNPMLELAFALPADLTFTLGTWWDVNSKAESSIGNQVQEVDVWAGLAYTYEKFTVGVTYQNWMYASETENILDLKLAYDCFLSPSITVHNRLDVGAAGSFDSTGAFSPGDEGTVVVFGLGHSIETGPVTWSFPLNVAWFVTEEFHAVGADSGIGYASLGANASISLTPYISECYGDWSFNAGLTYYVTDDGVIPNNPDSDFLTWTAGLAVNF